MAKPFSQLQSADRDLGEMDVVMVRTEPPFDRNYFYTTLLLDLLPDATRVLNRPAGLRNWNEKLAAALYPDLSPKTVITRDAAIIKDFIGANERVTLKPIDGFAGKGIVFLKQDSENLDQLIDLVTHDGSHRVIAQEYLVSAKEGDKR